MTPSTRNGDVDPDEAGDADELVEEGGVDEDGEELHAASTVPAIATDATELPTALKVRIFGLTSTPLSPRGPLGHQRTHGDVN